MLEPYNLLLFYLSKCLLHNITSKLNCCSIIFCVFVRRKKSSQLVLEIAEINNGIQRKSNIMLFNPPNMKKDQEIKSFIVRLINIVSKNVDPTKIKPVLIKNEQQDKLIYINNNNLY